MEPDGSGLCGDGSCFCRITINPADMDEPRIEAGDEIRCPHCRRWHVLVQPYRTGTQFTTEMLMWECRRGQYYAGQRGTSARYPTRRPHTAA